MTSEEALHYVKLTFADMHDGLLDPRRAYQTAEQLVRMVVIHSLDTVDVSEQPKRFTLPSMQEHGTPLVVEVATIPPRGSGSVGWYSVELRVGDRVGLIATLGSTATIMAINAVTDLATRWYMLGEEAAALLRTWDTMEQTVEASSAAVPTGAADHRPGTVPTIWEWDENAVLVKG